MDHVTKAQHGLLFWLFTWTFIFVYPMLISIYVFLPLLIGAMGYMLVQGLEREKTSFILLAIVYMVNLEVNLSLPIFLAVISSLLFYVLIL